MQWGLIAALKDASNNLREGCIAQAHSHLSVVIRALQDYSLAIWKSRNGVLHDKTALGHKILQAQLHHNITLLYALRDTFSPILQSYFSMPLADRLMRSPRQKQRWL